MNKVLYVDSKDEIFFINTDIIILIKGKTCKTLNDYFNAIYNKLNFPKENKYSLDAYIDWMTDATYFKGDSIILIIDNFNEFLNKDESSKNEVINTFKDSILPYWDSEVEKICVNGKKKLFNVYLLNGDF